MTLSSKTYKFKSRKRVFPKDTTSSQSMDVTDSSGPSQSMGGSVGIVSQTSKVEQPLKGFRIYIIGRLGRTKVELTHLIESLGGKVTGRVNENTTVCLSSQGEPAWFSRSAVGCGFDRTSGLYLWLLLLLLLFCFSACCMCTVWVTEYLGLTLTLATTLALTLTLVLTLTS